MSLRSRFTRLNKNTVFLLLVSFTLLPTLSAQAQNGRLIEDLFRTLAETQLEKERLKREEAQKRPPALKPPMQSGFKPSSNPYEVRLPSGFGPSSTPTAKPRPNTPRIPLPPPSTRPQVQLPSQPRTGSINVRSREAAAYAKSLVAFNTAMSPLVAELRRNASKHPEIRPLLPEVYQIAADGRALLNRCDGLSSLSSIVQPYQALDARWRQVSFALNSINGLGQSCASSIQQCDQSCASMCTQLQIQPQFDRRALHDQMVIAATYMQSIVDDLEISAMPQSKRAHLIHDCRLLRQRLLTAAHHVEEVSYDEVVQSFSAFVQNWGGFSREVYELHNPHLDRRMARISECGDQTYAILWMAPPPAMHDIAAIAHRLDAQFASLSDQITFRTISGLPRQDQIRVLNATSQLYEQSVALEKAADAHADASKLQSMFAGLDRTWISVHQDYLKIPSVNRGVLAEIERGCEELRHVLGVDGGAGVPITASQLIQAAAALEGTSEYINDLLKKHSRNLTPSKFRSSVTSASREFYTHARELHEDVSKPGRLTDTRYLSQLQREAQHMLEGWNQLARDLDHIEDHGLSRSVAIQIKRAARDITPFVAQVAAALLEG